MSSGTVQSAKGADPQNHIVGQAIGAHIRDRQSKQHGRQYGKPKKLTGYPKSSVQQEVDSRTQNLRSLNPLPAAEALTGASSSDGRPPRRQSSRQYPEINRDPSPLSLTPPVHTPVQSGNTLVEPFSHPPRTSRCLASNPHRWLNMYPPVSPECNIHSGRAQTRPA